MADFGWAFVKGNLLTGSAPPSGAVQFNDGNDKFAASGDFVFVSGGTSQLNLTGNMDVVGNMSASVFYGDGSNLTGVGGTPGGSDTQLQFNSGSLFSGSSNLTYDYTTNTLNITGTLNISGTLATNELVVNVENRNVINISATGSTQFGDSTDDTHVFTGSMSISASSNPLKLYGVQSGTPPNTSSYLALDSNYNLVLTSAAGESSGGTIGEAEDGDYTDGLFSDFLASTPIGTAIDKFNEILKIIVPGPAPSVDRIDYTNTSGVETKITFASPIDAPGTYVVDGGTGSFSAPSINDQYTVTTSGEDYRLGVYDGTQEITGVINFNVSEQLKSTEVNYSHDAFGNAESGSLKLYLNETLLHTLNLDGFTGAGNPNSGSASDLNIDGSGFFDISVSASATDQNGSTYDIFQHRTAKFVIDPNDQNKGWNYAKIEHEYGSVTYITNFVQWFNDTDASSQAMSVSNPRVTFTGNGSKYLSGVGYFRSASLEYNADVNNVYKYTYPTGNVLTFNVLSNVDSISAQSLLATDGTDLYNKVVRITGSTETNNDIMLNDSTTLSINLSHPLKTNLTSTGSVTVDEILIYNRDTANTNTLENFEIEEGYRIQINDYNSQSDVTSVSQIWSSNASIDSGKADGYANGLIYYNSRLYSPLQGANGGDFSSLTNGPLSNPNYSGVSGTQTFYRKIQNTTGSPVYDLKIISTKNTKINTNSLSNNDNVKFSVKIPDVTGWMVISSNFVYGSISDGHGALIAGASDNSNTGINDTGDSDHCITFGTASVAAGEYVVIKIEADAGWTKYFETLQFQLGAADVAAPTQAPALDDIDADNSGETNAKLSFGTSNPIAGYSNATGSSISLTDFDSNERYSLSGDRRGVFSSKPTLTGKLNEDVGANGSNYSADSFYNGYTGSLVLEVNGAEVHTTSIGSTLSSISNDFNGNSSGFSVSAVSFSTTSDGIPDYTKPYRTGTYQVGANDQNVGWNYARVIHRTATDQTTNYVEWVVDTSSSATSETNVSTPTLSDFNNPSIYYQSGIGYFAANPSGSFNFTGSNFYNNVYQNGTAISFPTTTNCAVSNIRITGSGINTFDSAVASCDMPALNNTADCELTSIEVTGTMTYDGGTSISGAFHSSQDVTVTGRILHPFKTDRTTATASKTAFMRYSGSIGSTTLTNDEYFGLETYRVVSGNYANQAELTSSSNTWNSQTEMDNGGSHDDGMVTANGYVLSPFNIGNAGDTRNDAEGSTGLQAPAGNPNYSTLTNDTRTYYRIFRYTGVTTISSFSMNLYGDATLVSKDAASPYYAALGANKNCTVELKVSYDPTYSGPDDQSTGWTDVAKIFDAGNQPNNDGAGIRSGASSGEDVTIDSGGLALSLTLGTRRIKQNQYYVVKVSAHKDWTGYISRIQVGY